MRPWPRRSSRRIHHHQRQYIRVYPLVKSMRALAGLYGFISDNPPLTACSPGCLSLNTSVWGMRALSVRVCECVCFGNSIHTATHIQADQVDLPQTASFSRHIVLSRNVSSSSKAYHRHPVLSGGASNSQRLHTYYI